MDNSTRIKGWFISALIFFLVNLYASGFFHKIFNSFNPNFHSDNSKVQYSQLVSLPVDANNSTERLSSDFFDSITYEEALKIDKPILFFTYTSSCPVSNHVKEVIYPIGLQYQNYFTFVVLEPATMSLSVPPADPINQLMTACHTSICVLDHKKNFLMSLDADINTRSDEITQTLNDFLVRSSKL